MGLYNLLNFPAGVVPVTTVTPQDEKELAFYRGYYRDRFDKSFQEVSFPLCLSCCWGGVGLVPLSVTLYHLSYSFTPSLKTHYFDLQVSLCPCEGRTTVQKQWFP